MDTSEATALLPGGSIIIPSCLFRYHILTDCCISGNKTGDCSSKSESVRSSLDFSQHGPIGKLGLGNGGFLDYPEPEVLI